MSSSRLLSRLDAAIAAAAHPLRADYLRAERAGYLARQGHLIEASQVIALLHERYDPSPNVLISAWLNLAEGLLSHFSDLSGVAIDKMRRAYALSGAARDTPLRALTAAWLAHMEYVAHDFELMARHLAESLQLADAEFHTARSRACLVGAQGYHLGGRYDLAQPWYEKARLHANADGDEAMLSAVMHNMAWLHAVQARQTQLQGNGPTLSVNQILLGAESALITGGGTEEADEPKIAR